jgi:chromosome segregation ATPase
VRAESANWIRNGPPQNLERVKNELTQANLDTAKAEAESKEKEDHHTGIQDRNDELHDQLDKNIKDITRANELIEGLQSSETQLRDENKELPSKIDEMKTNKIHIEKTLKDSITEKQNLETSYNNSLDTINNLEVQRAK